VYHAALAECSILSIADPNEFFDPNRIKLMSLADKPGFLYKFFRQQPVAAFR
jgi:hypothetical protein